MFDVPVGGSGLGALPSVPTSLGWGCRQHGPLLAIDSHSGRKLRFFHQNQPHLATAPL